MPPIPQWQLPSLWWQPRVEHPPTWRVVFLLPLENKEQDTFMKRLVDIDNDWPDRPDAEPRRLLAVPWLFDFIPDPSIISAMFTRGGNEPVIFIDEQSTKDDTALLLHCTEGSDDHQTLRVPIRRANLLLSAAAQGKVVLEGEMFQPKGYDVPAILQQGPDRVNEEYTVFVIEPMTPEELERLKSYACDRMCDEYEYTEWFYVADKLESPDMNGLIAWLESAECNLSTPPMHFIVVDRWSLEVADDEEYYTDLWAECVVASIEGAEYTMRCNDQLSFGRWGAGYGYSDRVDFEDAIGACMSLSQANQPFDELVRGMEYAYWKSMQRWTDSDQAGRNRFACGFEQTHSLEYWPSVEWDK